jgi:hypothetical protein
MKLALSMIFVSCCAGVPLRTDNAGDYGSDGRISYAWVMTSWCPHESRYLGTVFLGFDLFDKRN